jgi:hypothetical protein
VNWRHFQTFLWLRYRLLQNRIRRAGAVTAVITAVLAVLGVLTSVGAFAGALLLGLFALPEASPLVHLLVWDGIVCFFLFVWVIVLLSDLQRTEPLSLDKFLHLPVSLTGAFVVNYLSSLLNVRMILFAPAMLGLILGLSGSRGPLVLLGLPLLAAFFLMVTALTHQFQGWLASLMTNPRRRRSVVVFVTLVVVVLAQAPNLVVQFTVRKDNALRKSTIEVARQSAVESDAITAELNALVRETVEIEESRGRVPAEEYERRKEDNRRAAEAISEKLKRSKERQKELQEYTRREDEQSRQRLGQIARVASWCLPPLWLPLGVEAAAEGDALPAILGTLGLGLIGTASLWRSYRTTQRIYTGKLTSGGRKRAVPVDAPAEAPAKVPAKAPAEPGPRRELLLERKIPRVSEQAAAIALAGFRSLVRAPEAKMILLSPVIMVAVFGSLFATRGEPVPEGVRPLMAFGAVAMVMLGMLGFLGNQFGFDRSGFRVFVLCGASRRDILLGKNLAFVPYTATLGGVAVLVLQFLFPMPPDIFLSVLPQAASMYLVICILANWLSILAPLAIPAGTMRPSNMKAVPLLLHMAFVFLFPIALSPTLLPLGIEYALDALGWVRGWPVCLVLSLIEFAIVGFLYSLVLTWQGHVLQSREQRILEIVTAKAE